MASHRRQPAIASSLIVLLSRVVSVTASATCYMSDAKHQSQSLFYTPCNQNTPYSMCLRTGSSDPDTGCLPNGLSLNDGHYWRNGCTDPTFKSDYCLNALNACPNDVNGNSEATPCSGYSNSTTWCCGENNTACCGLPGQFTLAATLGPTSTTMSSSPSASPTTTSSPNAVSTAPPATSSSTSGSTGLSTGAQAGIGVGVSLAGLVVLALIAWFVLRSRRRRREHVAEPGQSIALQKQQVDGTAPGRWEAPKEDITKQQQVPPRPLHELGGSGVPAELPAR